MLYKEAINLTGQIGAAPYTQQVENYRKALAQEVPQRQRLYDNVVHAATTPMAKDLAAGAATATVASAGLKPYVKDPVTRLLLAGTLGIGGARLRQPAEEFLRGLVSAMKNAKR